MSTSINAAGEPTRHRALSADQLLELAGKVAAEKQDKATLQRLASAAEATGDEKLGTMVANLQKFASVSRAAEPAVMIDADRIPAEAVREYQDLLRSIEIAMTIGNRTALKEIEDELELLAIGLTDEQKFALTKKLKEAIESTPTQNAAADVLAQLSGASRIGVFQFGPVQVDLRNRGGGGLPSGGSSLRRGGSSLPARGSSLARESSRSLLYGTWEAYDRVNGVVTAKLVIQPSLYQYHDDMGHDETGQWNVRVGIFQMQQSNGHVDHYPYKMIGHNRMD